MTIFNVWKGTRTMLFLCVWINIINFFNFTCCTFNINFLLKTGCTFTWKPFLHCLRLNCSCWLFIFTWEKLEDCLLHASCWNEPFLIFLFKIFDIRLRFFFLFLIDFMLIFALRELNMWIDIFYWSRRFNNLFWINILS